jgi:hypothetical protein
MFSAIPSHTTSATAASQSHLQTAPAPDRSAEIAKDAARRVGLHMARVALEDEAATESMAPDLKHIILSGASYLLNEGYPYPVDVMLAKREDQSVDTSQHFFLRVHGPDKDSSYMADPLRWMDKKRRDELPPNFEKLFDQQETGQYALRNLGQGGKGSVPGVTVASIFTVGRPHVSDLDINLAQHGEEAMDIAPQGTAADVACAMNTDARTGPSLPGTAASSEDHIDDIAAASVRPTGRSKGQRTAQWVAMTKVVNASRLQHVAGQDDEKNFGIRHPVDLVARPTRGKCSNEKSGGAPYGRKASGEPLKAPRRLARPNLIAAGEALETVRRLAELALTDPEQAIAELYRRNGCNGHLGNRIALLMSMRPVVATAPFTNFVQLVNDLCQTGKLPPLKALNLLVASDAKTGGVVLLPSDVIGSHWSNAAAPIFAQTLQNIARKICETEPLESFERNFIVLRLGLERIDPYAIGSLQLPLSFYQKISQPMVRNGAAVQASRILASCGLVPEKSSKAFSYAGARMPHLPLTVELAPLHKLAVRNTVQFERTCELDADLDQRDLCLLTAEVPRPKAIPEYATAKDKLHKLGGIAAAFSVFASSPSSQGGRYYNPAERYSEPQRSERYSAAGAGIDTAALAAWAVPIRSSRLYGSEVISEIASRGPDDAESATRYAEHSSRRAQANFRSADEALHRATISATATVGNISTANAGDYITSRQEDRYFGGVDYRLFEASGSGVTPQHALSSPPARRREPETRTMLLKD